MDTIDSFVLQRIVHFLSINDYHNFSLTNSDFSGHIHEAIQKDNVLKTLRQINNAKNNIKNVYNNLIYLMDSTSCEKIVFKCQKHLTKLKKKLLVYRKYARYFQNHNYNLILTIENHSLTKLFSGYDCITLPILLKIGKSEINFDFQDKFNDHLIEIMNWFHPNDIVNVDNVYADCKITANQKYLKIIVYQKGGKTRECRLFVYFRPTLEMPSNGARFQAIIGEECFSFKVIDDDLFELDYSRGKEDTIFFCSRSQWGTHWKFDSWPIFNLHMR